VAEEKMRRTAIPFWGEGKTREMGAEAHRSKNVNKINESKLSKGKRAEKASGFSEDRGQAQKTEEKDGAGVPIGRKQQRLRAGRMRAISEKVGPAKKENWGKYRVRSKGCGVSASWNGINCGNNRRRTKKGEMWVERAMTRPKTNIRDHESRRQSREQWGGGKSCPILAFVKDRRIRVVD